MARVLAILGALFKAFRRSTQSLGSFSSNNFFLMSVIFLRAAGTFIYLIAGLVMLFPLSTDPLRKAPSVRLALWPLSIHERWLLRILTPWLNPFTWVIALLAIWMVRGRITVGLWVLMGFIFVIGFAAGSFSLGGRGGAWRLVPDFPGPLNHLIRKNLREMLSTLDFYCGLILSLSFLVCRIAGVKLPSEAFVALTVLVVLALSSYAQCLFGLDSDQALTRYRLLPLRGWQVLVSKGVAFLLLAFILTLPLAPVAGVAAALTALAVGHASSIERPGEQMRWRFFSGVPIGMSVAQVALMTITAGAVYKLPLLIVAALAAYVSSLWWYGAAIDKNPL